MGALTQVYIDPAIAANSGSGTVSDPYGDLQYALNTKVRDSTNGDQFNIKAGTEEVLAASLALTTYGTPTEAAPLVLRGYTSAANDGGIASINCNGVTMWASSSNSNLVLGWLKIYSGGNTNLVAGNVMQVIHCEVSKGASSPSGKVLVTVGASGLVTDCYVHDANTSGTGISGGKLVYGNYVYNCPTTGINDCDLAERNIIVDCGIGVTITTDQCGAKSNSIYSSTASTGKGISAGSGICAGIVMNNLIEGYNGAGGIPVSITSDAWTVGNNAYYNCNAESLADVRISIPSFILVESPFVNPAGGNFSIKPWLSSVIENGYPVSWYGPSNTINKAEIGAVQNGNKSVYGFSG